MSVWTEKDFEKTRHSLLETLPVPLIENLTADHEYFAASNEQDIWWIFNQEHTLMVYLEKSNQVVDLLLTECEMDMHRSLNLMTSSNGTDFCCISCFDQGRISIRYWPCITKQQKANFYFDWDFRELPDFVPIKLVGLDRTFGLCAVDSSIVFFTICTGNDFSIKFSAHLEDVKENLKTPILSTIKRRLTSFLRPHNESIYFPKDKVYVHLFGPFAFICNKSYGYLYEIDGKNSEQFKSKMLSKTVLSELMSEYSNIGDDIVCVGMKGLQNTLHLLMQSQNNQELLFHVIAMIDPNSSCLMPLSYSTLNTPVDVFGSRFSFSVSSTNRHIMLYNQRLACVLSGNNFNELLLVRFGGRICSAPYFRGGFLRIFDKQEGLCEFDLSPFCFCSQDLWINFIKPADLEVERLYTALKLHAHNQDVESYQIIENLLKEADVNQIIARLAVAICDLYLSDQLEKATESTDAAGIFDANLKACAQKRIIFKCLLNLLSTGDQTVVVTFGDGTERPLIEILASLYEGLSASEMVFEQFKILEQQEQQRVLQCVRQNQKVTHLAQLLSSVMQLRPVLPLGCVRELFERLIAIKSEVAREMHTSHKQWSITESEGFACDMCELVVIYITHQKDDDDPTLINFVLNFLDFMKDLSEETWKLLESSIVNSYDQTGKPGRALAIAERYKDWINVIRICLDHSLFDELARICELHQEEIVVLLVTILRRSGKAGILLKEPFASCNVVQMQISSDPCIGWIQLLRRGEYTKAFENVRSICIEEKRLNAKQIQLGICRLICTLTGITSPWLTKEEFIVHSCSLLSKEVYEKLNLSDGHVMEVPDLIQALCCEYIPSERKIQCYATALQLLKYCNDCLQRRELETMIITNCLLLDSWREAKDEVELNILNSHTQFFGLLSYIHSSSIQFGTLSISTSDIFANKGMCLRDKGLTEHMVSMLLECLTV